MLWITVIFGFLETFGRRIVPCQIYSVDGFVVTNGFEKGYFFLCEGGMSHSFDTLVEFPMDSSTGQTHKTPHG